MFPGGKKKALKQKRRLVTPPKKAFLKRAFRRVFRLRPKMTSCVHGFILFPRNHPPKNPKQTLRETFRMNHNAKKNYTRGLDKKLSKNKKKGRKNTRTFELFQRYNEKKWRKRKGERFCLKKVSNMAFWLSLGQVFGSLSLPLNALCGKKTSQEKKPVILEREMPANQFF